MDRRRVGLLVLGFLLVGAYITVAESGVMVHPTYLGLGRSYESEVLGTKVSTSTAVSAWGGTATLYLGGELGFLASLGVYVPTHVSTKVISGDQSISADGAVENGGIATAIDLGVGWDIDVAPSFRILLGGGLHGNLLSIFLPSGAEGDTPSTSVLGIGVQAIPMYFVSESVNVSAALRVSYSFLETGSIPERPEGILYTGALNWAVSLGAGFNW